PLFKGIRIHNTSQIVPGQQSVPLVPRRLPARRIRIMLNFPEDYQRDPTGNFRTERELSIVNTRRRQDPLDRVIFRLRGECRGAIHRIEYLVYELKERFLLRLKPCTEPINSALRFPAEYWLVNSKCFAGVR